MRIKIKSAETGISQYDLANRYLIEGLKNDRRKKGVITLEEIEELLDHDKPEGDTILQDLCGIVKRDDTEDAFK